jgi:hypothetical protein
MVQLPNSRRIVSWMTLSDMGPQHARPLGSLSACIPRGHPGLEKTCDARSLTGRGRPACDYIRGWLHYCLDAYLRLSPTGLDEGRRTTAEVA